MTNYKKKNDKFKENALNVGNSAGLVLIGDLHQMPPVITPLYSVIL